MATFTRAWEITRDNAYTLEIISGISRLTFEANIGWVLVLEPGAQFAIIPRKTFNADYPDVELSFDSQKKHPLQ
jgi:hypothetical protein